MDIEFTHAGPQGAAVEIEDFNGLSQPLGNLFDVKIHKKRYVIRAIPERRHGHRKNIQPAPEIVTENPFAGFLFQMAVCGGNNPYIYVGLYGNKPIF